MCDPHFLPVIDSAPQKSLGEEVNELTSSRLLKLEKDNQTLLKTVEELRGAASQDTVTKLVKVNQENQKLNQKVSTLLCTEVFLSVLVVVSFSFGEMLKYLPEATLQPQFHFLSLLRVTTKISILDQHSSIVYHSNTWFLVFSHSESGGGKRKRRGEYREGWIGG